MFVRQPRAESLYRPRWIVRKDLPTVLEIERASFPEPWGEEDFLECLRQRNCLCLVVEQGERVVAYMLHALFECRLNLIRLAVHPAHRHHSIGRVLVEKLASKLDIYRRTHITCSVSEGNLDGQLFLKACGFTAVRIQPGYFGREDGYRFVRKLPPTDLVTVRPRGE